METNDLKPLEWSKLGPINRAQITSFEAFDPVNGREEQVWDGTGAGHGWELSEGTWPSLFAGSIALVLPLQVFGGH